ncbi:MAG: hypothetical protein QNL68_14370 [Akkermansiaceae bacterium]
MRCMGLRWFTPLGRFETWINNPIKLDLFLPVGSYAAKSRP